MALTADDERTPLLASAATQGPEESSAAAASPTVSTRSASQSAVGNTTAKPVDSNDGTAAADTAAKGRKGWLASLWRPANRVLLAGFLISLSFSFTQVSFNVLTNADNDSIFYVIRLMECDVYYSKHPPYMGHGDRCSRNEIAAGTARQFSILGMSTTFCGTWNLFVTGHQVKKWGPRAALVLQTFIPAIRVATQIIGVVAGGQAGIWIIQLTQVITILGGPAGYILVVNTIASEIVPPAQRTALFGQLQGCIMLGIALGYLTGGIVGDTFGIIRPFQTAFFMLCLSSVYTRTAMPYISPESLSDPKQAKTRASAMAAFIEPLKVLAPQKIRLASGRRVDHYGVFFLCSGVFLGVLATGYAPILLQMYATAVFDFDQAQNGWLMSGNGFMRAIFLIFLFPHIISWGRHWFSQLEKKRLLSSTPPTTLPASTLPSSLPSSSSSSSTVVTGEETALAAEAPRETSHAAEDAFPTDPEQFEATMGTQAEEEPAAPVENPGNDKAAFAFDLFFLRWSLLVDGVLTACAALATEGWHMYLLTVLLPFGSGSAPAAKGVITSMCPPSQRTDALNAITLVENISRLATLAVFGALFSALAERGQSHLTFYFNGALAIVAMLVLMFSHFPPTDSELVDGNNLDDSPLLGNASQSADEPREDAST